MGCRKNQQGVSGLVLRNSDWHALEQILGVTVGSAARSKNYFCSQMDPEITEVGVKNQVSRTATQFSKSETMATDLRNLHSWWIREVMLISPEVLGNCLLPVQSALSVFILCFMVSTEPRATQERNRRKQSRLCAVMNGKGFFLLVYSCLLSQFICSQGWAGWGRSWGQELG